MLRLLGILTLSNMIFGGHRCHCHHHRQVLSVLGMILILSCIPAFLVLFTQLAGRMLPSILIGIALYYVFLRKN